MTFAIVGTVGCLAGPPPQYDDAGEGEEQDADENGWDAQHTPYDASADDTSSTYADTGRPDTFKADTRPADTTPADTTVTDTKPLDSGAPDAMADVAKDGCYGKANGSYCGGNLVPMGNTGTLYQCSSGRISSSAVCGAGCDPTKNACYATGGSEITSSGARMTASPATSACNFFAPSTCGDCADTSCCAEETACFGASNCTLLWNCLSACPSGDATCRQNCANQYPAEIARVNAIYSCVNTKCTTACGADPCANFPGSGYGNSCGANLSASASQNTLYWCQDKKTVTSVFCEGGCQAAESDYCKGSDPCVSSPFAGTNIICGRTLSAVVNQNSLYTCNGRTTVSVATCPSGCYVAPPNEADRCN